MVAATVTGAPTYWIHTDQLGTPQALTDASGVLVWDTGRGPFGELLSVTGVVAMPLRFPGQIFDTESGWHDNHHRSYDPNLGRYLQSDPIGLAAGVDTYGYVRGNPLNNTDQLGLWTLQIAISLNLQLGPAALQISSGFAVDNHGNIARIDVGGAGGGAGGRKSGGVSIAASNADNVGQLSSWFNNASAGVAAGPSASIDVFQGRDDATGKNIVGGGFTFGAGLGGGCSAMRTYTVVTPVNYNDP